MLGGVLQQLIITPSNDNHKPPRQMKKTTMQTTIVNTISNLKKKAVCLKTKDISSKLQIT